MQSTNFKTSHLEKLFAFHLDADKAPRYEIEYRFSPRRYRFDFAWPERMLAVEIEGGTWSGGRHTTGRGFAGDCVKYNLAVLLGWRVLRFTGAMVKSGEALAMTQIALRGEEPKA